jgi:hypothetical protein
MPPIERFGGSWAAHVNDSAPPSQILDDRRWASPPRYGKAVRRCAEANEAIPFLFHHILAMDNKHKRLVDCS